MCCVGSEAKASCEDCGFLRCLLSLWPITLLRLELLLLKLLMLKLLMLKRWRTALLLMVTLQPRGLFVSSSRAGDVIEKTNR